MIVDATAYKGAAVGRGFIAPSTRRQLFGAMNPRPVASWRATSAMLTAAGGEEAGESR